MRLILAVSFGPAIDCYLCIGRFNYECRDYCWVVRMACLCGQPPDDSNRRFNNTIKVQ